MSKTVAQIYAINPTTVVADTDLYYLVQSPYTPGFDAAITGADLKIAFGSGGTINPGLINQLGYYAASGSAISGLPTLSDGTLITSGAGAPSISQTLPSAVQTNITALGAQSIALDMNSHQINNLTAGVAATDAVNVGQLAALASPLTTKGDLYTFSTVDDRLPVGATNGQVLQVNSVAATGLAWSTATYPATATNVARILRSDGTNWVETTSTFADIYAASSILFSNIANNITGLPTANNGVLVTSNTGVPSILAGPGTTGNFLQSNAAAAPSWSASTLTLGGNFAMIGAFTFDGTLTGNTAVTFPTSGTLATTSQIPTLPLSLADGGTGASLTASNGGIVYSNATTLAILAGTATAGQILRSGSNAAPSWSTTTYPATNAVNTLLYASSANVMSALATANSGVLVTDSGGVPSISSTLPAFTTSSITFNPTTGGIVGTTTNDDADAGKVGEVGTATASGVSLVTLTAKTVTSVSLTAGDWDVTGSIRFTIGGTCSAIASGVSTTNNSLPAAPLYQFIGAATGTIGSGSAISAPMQRFSLSATTTVYLVAQSNFTTSTVTAQGTIFARRVR